MTIKQARVGRVKIKGRSVLYYCRCRICLQEYNVSPDQEIDSYYVCPDCEEKAAHGTAIPRTARTNNPIQY